MINIILVAAIDITLIGTPLANALIPGSISKDTEHVLKGLTGHGHLAAGQYFFRVLNLG
jgi:hypothetical protein